MLIKTTLSVFYSVSTLFLKNSIIEMHKMSFISFCHCFFSQAHVWKLSLMELAINEDAHVSKFPKHLRKCGPGNFITIKTKMCKIVSYNFLNNHFRSSQSTCAHNCCVNKNERHYSHTLTSNVWRKKLVLGGISFFFFLNL